MILNLLEQYASALYTWAVDQTIALDCDCAIVHFVDDVIGEVWHRLWLRVSQRHTHTE